MKPQHIGILKSSANDSPKKVVFDKTANQNINLGNSVLNGVRTIEFFVKLTSNVTAEDTLISRFPGGSATGRFDISFNTGNILKFLVNNGSGNSLVTTTRALKVGVWYHIAFRIDAVEGADIFVNGVKDSVNGSAITNAFTSVTTNTYVGGVVDSSFRYTNFELKHLKFWTVSKVQDEITYDQTYLPNGLENGLRAYWNFENFSAGSCLDITGNYTAIFQTATGTTESMVLDTPVTDYYQIDIDNSVETKYIDIPNAKTTNIKSVSFNYNPNNELNTTTSQQFIFGNGRVSNANGLFLVHRGNGSVFGDINPGDLYITAWDSSATYFQKATTSPVTLEAGRNYYFSIVCDDAANEIMLYMNGVLLFIITGWVDTYLPNNATYNYSIGKVSENSVFRSNGKFGKISIWSKTLSLTEVTENQFKRFDGTETDLVFYPQLLQGEGNKIYDFKDDTEATINSTSSDQDDMWKLSTIEIIPNLTSAWELIGSNVLLGDGLIGYTADTVGYKGANFKWIPANTDFELSFELTQYYPFVGNQSSVSIGLAEINTNSDITLYEFGAQALYLTSTGNIQFRVREDAGIPGVNLSAISLGDKIAIKRNGDVIQYLLNDVILFTSSKKTKKQFLINLSVYADLGAENIKLSYTYQ